MGRYRLCKEWKFVETVEATCPHCSMVVTARTPKYATYMQGYGAIRCSNSKCRKKFRLDSYYGEPT